MSWTIERSAPAAGLPQARWRSARSSPHALSLLKPRGTAAATLSAMRDGASPPLAPHRNTRVPGRATITSRSDAASSDSPTSTAGPRPRTRSCATRARPPPHPSPAISRSSSPVKSTPSTVISPESTSQISYPIAATTSPPRAAT
ncbi:MAG: hypothetical protein R3F14_44885 [Polyangiaceae bacterium]